MTIPYAHMKSAKPRNNIEQILQCFNAEGQKDLIAIDNETLRRILPTAVFLTSLRYQEMISVLLWSR